MRIYNRRRSIAQVVYKVKLNDGEVMDVDSPAKLVDSTLRESISEPYVTLEIFCPKEYSYATHIYIGIGTHTYIGIRDSRDLLPEGILVRYSRDETSHLRQLTYERLTFL